jgi:hypothetical protein
MATGVNFYALALKRLEMAFDEHTLQEALLPFSHAITKIETAIDKARIDHDDVYADFFLDDDLDLMETHLGSAFVTCQVFLTAVVSRVKALHKYTRSQGRPAFSSTTSSKRDILATGSGPVPGSTYTQIQVIDAFANYFKHRDEWAVNWSTLDAQSRNTATIITSVGASQGSTGNLRTGAEALGIKFYHNIDACATVIANWKDSLCGSYQRELLASSLVS